MSALAATMQELYDDIAARHGGAESLSLTDRETVLALTRLYAQQRQAEASDLPRIASAIANLTATLPPVDGPAAKLSATWDLGGLSDADFGNVLSAACIALGGENVVRADGSFDVPMPFVTLPELISRYEALRGEVVELREALSRARVALEARDLGALITGLGGVAPGKPADAPDAPEATKTAANEGNTPQRPARAVPGHPARSGPVPDDELPPGCGPLLAPGQNDGFGGVVAGPSRAAQFDNNL